MCACVLVRACACICHHDQAPFWGAFDSGQSAAHSSTISLSHDVCLLVSHSASLGSSGGSVSWFCLVIDNLSAQEPLAPLVNWTSQRQTLSAAPSVRCHGWATMHPFVHWPESQYAPSVSLLVSPPVSQRQ